MSSFVANARWEILRLFRSQRIFLWLIPPVAGPIGSGIAFLYLRVPSNAVALILGLFVTGGLAGLVMLDLAALSLGEELSRRAHLVAWVLPQRRGPMLSGRLAVVFGGSLGAFAVGAALLWPVADALVPATAGPALIPLAPTHLFLGLLSLLFFLGSVTFTASTITRSASEALVVGVLGSVVTVAVAGFLLVQHDLTALFPVALSVVAAVLLGASAVRVSKMES